MAADLLARSAELSTQLESAVAAWRDAKGDPSRAPLARFELDAAQVAVASYRQYWRQIGLMVPENHEGYRPSVDGRQDVLGIRVAHDTDAAVPGHIDFIGAGGTPKSLVDGRVLPRVSGGAMSVSGLYITTWKKPHDGTDTVIDYVTTDTIKGALFTNSITTNLSTDTAYTSSPYTSNEVTGTGYTTGGVTLGTKTLTESPTGTLMYDAADSAWTTATFSSARGQLIYDSTVSSLCLCLINFGADFAVTAGTFTVQYAATGIWTDDITP